MCSGYQAGPAQSGPAMFRLDQVGLYFFFNTYFYIPTYTFFRAIRARPISIALRVGRGERVNKGSTRRGLNYASNLFET